MGPIIPNPMPPTSALDGDASVSRPFATPRSYMLLSLAAAVATIALKTVAWRLTGSVGLLSDAMESGVNLIAAIGAFWALTLAAKPADRTHHYGHFKAEYGVAPIQRTGLRAPRV